MTNHPPPDRETILQEALAERVTKAIFRGNFADSEDERIIAEKAVEWREDYAKAERQARLVLAILDMWCPIETAPTDDDALFMVFNWNNRRQPVYDVWCGRYLAENREKIAAGTYDDAPHLRWEPTHWRPLPDPPALSPIVSDRIDPSLSKDALGYDDRQNLYCDPHPPWPLRGELLDRIDRSLTSKEEHHGE